MSPIFVISVYIYKIYYLIYVVLGYI